MARVLRRTGAMERRIRSLESGETGPGRYSVREVQESVSRYGWGSLPLERIPTWVTEWDDRGYNEKYEAGLLDSWIPALDVSYIGGDYPWWVLFARKMNLVVNEIQVDHKNLMEVMRQLLPDESFGAIKYRDWEVRGYLRGEGGVGRVTSTVVFLEEIELTGSDELWSSENLELVVTSFVAGLTQPQVGGWHRLDLPLYHSGCGGVSDLECAVHLWCQSGRSERLEELFSGEPCKYRRDMRDVMVPTTLGSFTAAPDRVWAAGAVGEVRWLPGSAMAVEAAGLYPLLGHGIDPSAWVREVRTQLKYQHQQKTYYCVRRLNRGEIMGVLDVPDGDWDMLTERDWKLILRSLLKTPIRCRQVVAEVISEFLEDIRQERARTGEEEVMVEDGEAMEEVVEGEGLEEMQEENADDGRGTDPNAVIYSAGEETDQEDEDDW
jgi:hypothetical protein